jgi:glutaredoxin
VSAPPPVLLYVRADCPHSAAVRQALAARGARVREIDVGASPRAIPELLKLTGGRRIVPVIVDAGVVQIAPDGGTEF